MRRKGPSLRSYAAAEAFLAQNLSDLDSFQFPPHAVRWSGKARDHKTLALLNMRRRQPRFFEAGLLTGQGFLQSSTGLDNNCFRSTDPHGRTLARTHGVRGRKNQP